MESKHALVLILVALAVGLIGRHLRSDDGSLDVSESWAHNLALQGQPNADVEQVAADYAKVCAKSPADLADWLVDSVRSGAVTLKVAQVNLAHACPDRAEELQFYWPHPSYRS